MIRYILTIFIDWMNCHHEVFHCLGIAHLYFNFSYLTFIYCFFSFSDFITYIIYIRFIDCFVGVLHSVLKLCNVIGLLIVIPLMSWVLQEEPYIDDIISLFHKLINSSRKFYFTLMSLTQVLTYFLLFGSITMMYQFVDMFL